MQRRGGQGFRVFLGAFVVAAPLASLGCGGSSTSEDSDAGRGGSGGTSGRTTPPETPPAAGLSISLSPALAAEVDVGNRACPAGATGAFTYMLGKPAPKGTIADGTSDTEVHCSVFSGNVDGVVGGYDNTTRARLGFSVSGTLSTAGAVGTGTVTFYSTETLTLTVTGDAPPCMLGPASVLKNGAILSDFDCPLLVGVDESTSACRASGTFAFEYCATR